MKSIKKMIYLFMFMLMVSFVYAEQVIIFNFNYDNGLIALKEQFIKEGYHPDRKIASEGDYTCNLVGLQNKKIYSFNFDLPPKLFTDIVQDNRTIGGIIRLSNTDFSVIAPYSEDLDKIVCYNPRGYEILQENVKKPELSPEKTNIWFWIYLALALIGFAIVIYMNRKK